MTTDSIPRSADRSQTRARRRVADDRLALGGDLLRLVWAHKLWWAVPVLIALLLLAMLVVLQATPLGPLIYPMF